MNCNECLTTSEIIARGNDFFFQVNLYKKLEDGSQVPFDLTVCDYYKCILHKPQSDRPEAESIGLAEGTINGIIVDAKSLRNGEYIIEVTGSLNSRKFRCAERGIIGITEYNADANVSWELIEGEDSNILNITFQLVESTAVVGKNAYELAKEQGYEGTLQDFLEEMVDAGQSAAEAREAASGATAATQSAITATNAAIEATENAITATANAQTAASNAQTAANNAINATTAATQATNSAITVTQSAITATISATTAASQAFENANKAETAATQANTAASQATESAQRAETAASSATTAAISATTAALNADEKAELANSAATSASTAAEAANTARIEIEANEATRQANEAARQTNEAVRQSNEEQRQEIYYSKANVNEHYPDLTVGASENILDNEDVVYAQKYKSVNDVSDGVVRINGVKGQTIKWNEKRLNHGKYSSRINNVTLKYDSDSKLFIVRGTATAVGTTVFNGNYPIQLKNFKQNHKYYIGGTSNITLQFYCGSDSYWPGVGLGSNKKGIYNYGAETPTNNYGIAVRVENYKTYNEKFYFHVIDVTEIYGKDNEPSTPEQFEADYFKWFGKPLTYEAYDDGSLRTTTTNALKTVGFNQYNSQTNLIKAFVGSPYQVTGTYTSIWESDNETVTFIDYAYGDEAEIYKYYTNSNKHYQCGADITLYSNESTYQIGEYTVYNSNIYKCNTRIATAEEFDSTKWNLLADIDALANDGIFSLMDVTIDANDIFTPSKYYLHVEGGNSADTCVHLVGDGSRNGEYKEYKEYTTDLPITSLTGRLNASGDSVVVFPDGMKRVNDIYDEIVVRDGKTWAIKRVGSVNMGELDWSYNVSYTSTLQGNPRLYDSVVLNEATDIPNILIAKDYIVTDTRHLTTALLNKGITIGRGGTTWSYSRRVLVCDDSYSSPEAFKTAMQGVTLYYELANPQEYLLDYNLPNYQVENLGTEEQLQSAENGIGAEINVTYSTDVLSIIDSLPKNYISIQSATNMLAKIGNELDGTFAITYDDANNVYDITFKSNAVNLQENHEKGYIIAGGEFRPNASYLTSDYIPIDAGDVINVKTTGGQIPPISFWDADKNFVSLPYPSSQRFVANLVVPSNVAYVRLSTYYGTSKSFIYSQKYQKNLLIYN